MLTIAAQFEQIALLILVIIAIGAMTTWMLRRRRRDVWQQLARTRGLTFSDPSDGPRIRGMIDERAVEVTTDDTSSDRDFGGVEVVRLSVSLQKVPIGMTAEGVPGLIGDLAVLAEESVELEPEEFHRDVLIRGDGNAARSYWTEHRKHVFLALVRTAPCDQVFIRDGRLTAEMREVVSDHHRLEQLLEQLLDAATVLDEPAGQQGHDQ